MLLCSFLCYYYFFFGGMCWEIWTDIATITSVIEFLSSSPFKIWATLWIKSSFQEELYSARGRIQLTSEGPWEKESYEIRTDSGSFQNPYYWWSANIHLPKIEINIWENIYWVCWGFPFWYFLFWGGWFRIEFPCSNKGSKSSSGRRGFASVSSCLFMLPCHGFDSGLKFTGNTFVYKDYYETFYTFFCKVINIWCVFYNFSTSWFRLGIFQVLNSHMG